MRIDYVAGGGAGTGMFDGSLWFFDGDYVGYDDQIGVADFAEEGSPRMIEFHYRVLKEGLTEDQVDFLICARSLDEAEPFLKPSGD